MRLPDTPGQMSAKARGEAFKEAARGTARQQGRPELADAYDLINRDLQDIYKTNEMNKILRRGYAAAGLRGGLVGASAGGAAGVATQDPATTGTAFGVGGLLGVLGYPANLYRAGSMAGRVAGAAPTLTRGYNLGTDDIVEILRKALMEEEEPTPVGLRRP